MTKAEHWNPSLEKTLDSCSNPVWQELAWAIGSAPMLDPETAPFPTLWNEDYHEQALLSFRALLPHWETISSAESEVLGAGTMRLGKRFERLINWWFESNPEWKVLAKNLVIQGNERTLGEMDLIIQNRESSRVLHLEVACKFYLQIDSSRDWEHWVGMDPKDRLDLKCRKLKNQFLLDRKPEASALLSELNIQIDHHAAWMKGWYFIHFRDAMSARLPHHANRSASSGWWCRLHEWEDIWTAESKWIIIPAQHWMRTRHNPPNIMLIAERGIVKDTLQKWKHVMVAQVQMHAGQWRENMRGIIVRDEWPHV